MHAGTIVNQIDSRIIDQSAPALAAAAFGSLLYRVEVIENHCHSTQQIFGLTSNTMAQKSTSPIVVTAGNAAWGTEIELHNGSTINGGNAAQYFDMNNMMVTAVGTANRVTMMEFYANVLGGNVAATTQIAGDTLTKAGHGLANGTKVMVNTIVNSTGINIYTVYYVVGSAANTFQLSLTLGGAAVDIATADGTCNYTVVTPTLITETMVSKAATSSDALAQPMQMPRQTCNTRISCRGWAAGGTNAISFFLGLHTYPS